MKRVGGLVTAAVAAAVVAAAAFGSGYTTEPVSNINPGPAGSFPSDLTDVGGTLFFTADDGTHGIELWRSDGTAAGTQLVRDIDGIPPEDSSSPAFLTAVGGRLFFSADDGVNGRELWMSDGTTAGTQMVEDLTTPGPNKAPTRLADFNGTLLFTIDGGEGREVWRSDGTPGGTEIVKDINTTSPTAGSNPSRFEVVGDHALFGADDGVNGYELWRTDGTEPGTFRVANIVPGAGGSSAQPLSTIDGVTYLFVITPGEGQELWRTDGTEAQTRIVKDINPDAAGSLPSSPVEVAGGAVFAADDGTNGTELWTTDGTPGGTNLLADINPGPDPSNPFPSPFAVIDGRVVFAADDGDHGLEPWVTDGTPAGTTMLADVNPGPGDGADVVFGFPAAAVNDRVFFGAGDVGAGVQELWSTDGTPGGTALEHDIQPGPLGSTPMALAESAGRLFFSADDGATGRELWRSADITPPETTIVSGPREGRSSREPVPNFDLASDDPRSRFECRFGGDAFAPCSGGASHTPARLPDGRHSFEARAVDVAGNADPTPAARGFTVDTRVRVQIRGKRVPLSPKGVATVRVRCPVAELSGPCRGTLALKSRAKVRIAARKRRRVTFAKKRFKVPVGKTRRVKLRVRGRKARLVRRSRRARAIRAIARARDGAGNRRRSAKRMRVVPKRKRRRR